MKHYLHLAAICAALSLTSCYSPVTDALEDVADQSAKQTKTVQFVMKGITEEYSTRATITSVGCTDLWVWEGSTLLKHQVSTDADFGMPSISLTYGSHDLTFLASKSDGQSLTDGVWSTTHVVDDFATTLNVTVSGGSSNSRQVQLNRRSSRVKFVTTDAVPSTVQKMHLKVANHLSLDASLAGGSAYTHEATVDISSKQGSTFSVLVNVLTESATDEEDCPVMIEFLGAGNAVLYHYDRTLSLKPNRCVSLTGSYFSGESSSVSIASTDWDNVEQGLYD